MVRAHAFVLSRKGQKHARLITAIDIADAFGLNQKTYRQALRDQARQDRRLSWHGHNARWVVEEGAPAYDAMLEVAKRLAGQSP